MDICYGDTVCYLLTNLNFKLIISKHCHSGLDPESRAILEKFWTPDQVRGDKTEKFVANIFPGTGVKTQDD